MASVRRRDPEGQLSLTAQEWLPVVATEDGRLIRKDGQELRLLEVGSVHLHLRSAAERRRVYRAEEELYNGLRFPVMRLALPRPVDLGQYLDSVLVESGRTAGTPQSAMLLDKLAHMEQLVSERQLVQWLNLVVLSGPTTDNPGQELPLAERMHLVRSGLERCGLKVTELDSGNVAQVWTALMSPDEMGLPGMLDGTVLDRITPQEGLEFSAPDRFWVGKQVCRVLAVTGYPRRVSPGQFAELYRLDRRVVVAQHFHPTNSAELLREFSNSVGEMQARMAGTLTEYEREAIRARLKDAQRLLRKLAGENHSVLDLCTYLVIRTEHPEELDPLTRRIFGRLEGKGMQARILRYGRQAQGFLACLPVAMDPLRGVARRNVPAESVPATFPYSSAELTHGEGVVMGLNKETGNLVLVDPWKLMNAHSIFIGPSGCGKTFTLNELTIQFWSWGIPVRSIDIEGDKSRLCQELGGQRVRLAPHAGNFINPMEVRRQALDPARFLDIEGEEPANGLAATIQRQLILFSLLLPDVSPLELSQAETLLIRCYQDAGITFETDYSRLASRDWPTWGDLYRLLDADAETPRLAAVMHSWVHGSLSGMLNGHTNVNLESPYVVLDIHDVMGHRLARAPVFFQAMTFLWDEINQDWRERKILDIDELGILADKEDALEFIWRVCKSARRRRCRVQLATQDPADVLSGRSPAAQKYVLGIMNNCATKVLGYQEPKALEELAKALKLSDAEVVLLGRLRREEKLIICGEQRAHVDIVASPRELVILDPEQARALLVPGGPG